MASGPEQPGEELLSRRSPRPGLRHDGRARGAARGRALPRHQHRSRVLAEELRAALGGLKGPLMKVAQLLATIPEALPKEYAAELAHAAVAGAAHGPAVRAAGAWPPSSGRAGGTSSPTSSSMPPRPPRSARSIARPRWTARLAYKLQYPSIESAVEADLAQLRLLFGVALRRLDQPRRIYDELAERLREAQPTGARQAHGALPAHAARQIGGAGAGRAAGAVERPAADDDLARRAASARAGGRRRRSATGSPTTCSAPGTCRSTSTP